MEWSQQILKQKTLKNRTKDYSISYKKDFYAQNKNNNTIKKESVEY